ncbi:sensor histidine kinase [Ekhidna sp.]
MTKVLTKNTFAFIDDPFCRAFLDSTKESIIVVDSKGHIISASKSAFQMFGYEKEVLNGKMFNLLIPMDGIWDIEEIQTKKKNLRQPNIIGIRNDGFEFPVALSITHVPGEEDILIIFVTDEPERNHSEQSKDINRQYFNVAEVILLALNMKGEVIDINKKGCEVLEYTEEELLGKNWFELSIEDKDDLEEVFLGVLKGTEDYRVYDNHVVTKSGHKKLIHWQNTVVTNEDGKVVGSLSSGMDITEKKKILTALQESEEKLRSYSKGLEKEVEERTKELQELLNKERGLSEMKSKFVSLASHEFRTPLSTILSSASLISKYPDTESDDKRLKHVNRIKSSVDHLNGILEDFLSLDRLNEGRVACQPEPFEMEDVFEEVESSLSPILKPGQTLESSHSGIAQTMTTDKKLVRNVLVNLVSNAIKYSPENKPIYLRCEFISKEMVVCEIEDKGIGIPEEDQIHLFERFFRANNTRNFQGTGLGLSIVKRYIELLGGEISFKSSQSNGTTFKVTIPVRFKDKS